MTVKSILQDKRDQLFRSGNPLDVEFTMDEINCLGDVNKLRHLKLSLDFPENFEKSNDLFDCTYRILNGDHDYRILEFCCMKNKILSLPVSQVFPKVIKP